MDRPDPQAQPRAADLTGDDLLQALLADLASPDRTGTGDGAGDGAERGAGEDPGDEWDGAEASDTEAATSDEEWDEESRWDEVSSWETAESDEEWDEESRWDDGVSDEAWDDGGDPEQSEDLYVLLAGATSEQAGAAADVGVTAGTPAPSPGGSLGRGGEPRLLARWWADPRVRATAGLAAAALIIVVLVVLSLEGDDGDEVATSPTISTPRAAPEQSSTTSSAGPGGTTLPPPPDPASLASTTTAPGSTTTAPVTTTTAPRPAPTPAPTPPPDPNPEPPPDTTPVDANLEQARALVGLREGNLVDETAQQTHGVSIGITLDESTRTMQVDIMSFPAGLDLRGVNVNIDGQTAETWFTQFGSVTTLWVGGDLALEGTDGTHPDTTRSTLGGKFRAGEPFDLTLVERDGADAVVRTLRITA